MKMNNFAYTAKYHGYSFLDGPPNDLTPATVSNTYIEIQ